MTKRLKSCSECSNILLTADTSEYPNSPTHCLTEYFKHVKRMSQSGFFCLNQTNAEKVRLEETTRQVSYRRH